MKKYSIVSLLICTLLLFGCAGTNNTIVPEEEKGFNITFYNNTDKLICYTLYWIDHDFEGYGGVPAPCCSGELIPGEEHNVNNGYTGKVWVVHWFGCRTDDFNEMRLWELPDNVSYVLTTPIEDLVELRGTK